MHYLIESHRNAFELLENNPLYKPDWITLKSVIENITDEQLVAYFLEHSDQKNKSLSVALNKLLKDKLVVTGWRAESPIFQDSNYLGNKWRLDFAKNSLAIEVGFNHSGVIAWNLTKLNLSSELNHVTKAIQTHIGIVITATESLRKAGGFDSAIGTFEKFLIYLKPMQQMLTVPILVIGLEAPDTIKIIHEQQTPSKKIGIIQPI